MQLDSPIGKGLSSVVQVSGFKFVAPVVMSIRQLGWKGLMSGT